MSHKGFDDESSLGTSWSSDPFSSGLSTPFGSELGSTETESSEDEDFMAELTRQMANYMLEGDDENRAANNSVSEHTEASGSPAKWSGSNSTSTYYCDQRFMSISTKPTLLSATANTTGIYYNKTFAEGQIQPIEVYQLKNQPPIKQENYSRLGRRGEIKESAKQPKLQQLQHEGQHQHQHHRKNKGRGGHGHGNSLSSTNGSGMRAIFLNGGSGSRNGSSGTGVFLPRVINNQTESIKRPGCSTVLIPARVLQALESHFNNMDALSQSNGCGGYTNLNPRGDISEKGRNSQLQTPSASNNQEMQLPEDWTY